MAGIYNLSSLISIVVLELAVLLSLWVGDQSSPTKHQEVIKSCDVTNSSIVRKLVQKNWNPVLSRYGVSLPIECPLNLSRDLLGARESLKRARSSHWSCVKCGKKFFIERYLDLHIERRHSEIINNIEDSVCLGNFCDIMRCDVLLSSSFLEEGLGSTDISIWSPSSLGQTQPTQEKKQASPPQESSSSMFIDNSKGNEKRFYKEHKSASSSTTNECDEEHFTRLRKKCTDLVWQCLQGLISVLDAKDFKTIQNELESTSCSYLSCSRYGDTCCSTNSKTRGKLRPFFILFGSLLISLCLALAYYFAWVYTQNAQETEEFRSEPENLYYEDFEEDSSSYRRGDINSHIYNSNNSRQTLINRTTHL